jgi:alpha-galactosidase
MGFFGQVLAAGLLLACVAAGAAPGAVELNRAWALEAFGMTPPPAPGVHRAVVVSEAAPGETKLRRCSAGGPMRLGDKSYEHGLGVNSPSVVRVELAQPAERFEALVGLDRNVDGAPASVRFHVRVGGKAIHSTEVLRPGVAPLPLSVPLGGATSFELEVDEGGDGRAFDQADWADARVTLRGGAVVRIDEMPLAPSAAWLPFSFVYGGKPSSALTQGWERTVTTAPAGPGATRHILTLRDPETGLEVAATLTLYTDTAGADWTVRFTNRGTADTPVLEQVCALDTWQWLGALSTPASLLQLKGSTAGAEDWAPIRTALTPGMRKDFAPSAGRSSLGASPFYTVRWPDGGVVTAIGWTGAWSATVSRVEGPLRLIAGIPGLRARLAPGESVRSPRILQVRWSGGDEAVGHNLFRRTMLAHIVPKTRGRTITPPIAHLTDAFYETDRSTEQTVLSHVAAIKGLGFETVWHDAYFGLRDFPNVGDFVMPLQRGVNSTRFPRGLKPIGDAAHAAGMKFLQWFEPERVCPGSIMAKEHPGWVVMPAGQPWGGVNLGDPAAREYVTETLITAIREYGIDQLRIDNAVDYAAMWRELDLRAGPDRAGIAENRYVEGHYAVWDRLLALFPDLLIDNCASGGQRIDLETCARSIPLWRTDGTIGPLLEKRFEQAALQNQLMSISLNRYLPYHVSGQMGAAPYLFRSGLNGGIAFCEDVRPAAYPREQLRRAIVEAKRLRKYFAGDFYPLTEESSDERAWCILQYDRPEQGDGMVIAFRRPRSPYPAFVLEELQGIDPAARYHVTWSTDYTPGKPQLLTGKQLLAAHITIDQRPGSVVMEYRKVGAKAERGE